MRGGGESGRGGGAGVPKLNMCEQGLRGVQILRICVNVIIECPHRLVKVYNSRNVAMAHYDVWCNI